MRILNERYEQNVPLDTLHDWDGNPNDGDDTAVGESLAETGFYGVLICDIDTRKILAGHTRKRSLLAAGETVAPAVQWVRTDDADHARAVLLGDNRINRRGQDDRDRLLEALRVQAESARGLAGTGFGQVDVEDLMAQQREAAATAAALGRPAASDEVPDPPAVPVTKAGDVWLLGEHRLLCGDARLVADYERVLTDLDGDQGMDEVKALWAESFGALHKVMPPGLPYYIFGPQGGDLGLLLLLLRDAGLSPRHILIWVKNRPSFSIGRLDYDYQHEPIVYGWNPGGPHHWHATDTRTSILPFDRPQASPDHPTTKPLALIAHLVLNSTRPGDVVCDPFSGSGTTLMVCEQEGRLARCLEIDPRYCDVIAARFERHTGTVPILGATGEPHTFTEAV